MKLMTREDVERYDSIGWLLTQGVTLETPLRDTFSHALICTRYLDGKCEPHASEAAKDLVRAFRSHLRRCERKGLPIMEAEPLRAPYVPEDRPATPIYWSRGAYTTYGRGDRPFGWSERQPQHEWRISKKKGGGRKHRLYRNGELIGVYPSRDEAEEAAEALAAA